MSDVFLSKLDTRLRSATASYAAGHAVFRTSGRVQWLHRVVDGRVRLCRVLRRGSEITLARFTVGDIVAEASVFASRYHCDAVAETPTTLRRYAMRDVKQMLESDPAAAVSFGMALAADVRDLRALLEIREIRRAEDRLLAWLQSKSGGAGTFTLPVTWLAVAREIGMTGESIYRALARLARSGRIKRTSRTVALR